MAVATTIAERMTDLCRQAAGVNRSCAVRQGNVVELTPEHGDDVMVVADLHGNRLNLRRLLEIADLAGHPRRHLIMQEVCHGGPEYPGDGGCMSHLMLEDMARLTCEFPGRFHFLLSNHELSELGDFPICKSRKMLNLLFRNGITEMYGDEGERVRDAYMEFIASSAIAIRVASGIFISHSLPEKCDRDGFDTAVFTRPLSCADWRSGSGLFRLVWGRDFRSANAEAFAKIVGAELLVHGHEPCSAGFSVPNSRQVILDGSGPSACYLLIPIGPKLTQPELIGNIHKLYGGKPLSGAARQCGGK
ncbi:MAG: hypothetical protein ACKVP0_16905 [Pirellulaceae bacterium]